jgi:hypothetical protein
VARQCCFSYPRDGLATAEAFDLEPGLELVEGCTPDERLAARAGSFSKSHIAATVGAFVHTRRLCPLGSANRTSTQRPSLSSVIAGGTTCLRAAIECSPAAPMMAFTDALAMR